MSKLRCSEKEDRARIARAQSEKGLPSLYPGWHPSHVCGIFCDGQDGGNSDCVCEKRAGAPGWFLSGVKDRGILSGPVFETVIRKRERMETVVGDSVGGFIVKEIIHTGSWGNVYKVQPQGINQTYALKMATSADSQRRLHTEREILDKIGGHRNITKIYFCGNDVNAGDYDNGELLPSGEHDDGEGFFYIVEEYATTNLRKKLNEWGQDGKTFPSFKCTVGIIKQILEGLNYAHIRKVIHQDLKPDNILLTRIEGETGEKAFKVQLCDFGLAYLLDTDALESSLDDAKTVAGSIHYLSPEQRSGKKIDSRTDLYNVGLIFYELLTYRRPTINLVKTTEVLKKLLSTIQIYGSGRPDHLPEWVDTFILKTLSADPADRYKNADEMLKAIDKAMNPPKPSKPVEIYVPPKPEPGMMTKLWMGAVAGINKTGRGAWWLTKAIAFLPIAVVFAPFVFCVKAMGSKFVSEVNAELPVMGITALWAVTWYLFLVPYGFQLNVEHQLSKSPPSGTILYYRSSDTAEDPQGFYFVRGAQLPKTINFHIETPEIGAGVGIDGFSFEPKYALSTNGKLFYYTTPNSLVRIRLDTLKTSSDFRKIVVRSEVFNYFSVLNFVDGPQGVGLYAKLKNETWFITKEGLLQQTPNSITITNYVQRVNEDFYADGNTVELNSNLLGNISIGPDAQGEAVWYSQTLKPLFGWRDEVRSYYGN